jgi:hypothetical protein
VTPDVLFGAARLSDGVLLDRHHDRHTLEHLRVVVGAQLVRDKFVDADDAVVD